MKPYLIIGIALLLTVTIVIAFFALNKNEEVPDVLEDKVTVEDDGESPNITPSPIIKPDTPNTDDKDEDEEDSETKEDIEGYEPPVGNNNLNLDIGESIPPVKNPDPSASVDEVIYGTKGENDGK